MLTLTYLILSGLGCLYILISAFLGHLGDFGDGGHGDGGGHSDGGGHADGDGGADGHADGDGDGGHYGVDGGGVGKVSAGDMGGAFHFPFFSPLAIATLFTAIGAWGLIARYAIGVSDANSLLIALPASVATAYAVTYAGWRMVSSSRGTSMILAGQFAGTSGEVLTPIPEEGVGEVAALVNGQRFTASARDIKGRAIARGKQVRIVRMSGATLLVESEEG